MTTSWRSTVSAARRGGLRALLVVLACATLALAVFGAAQIARDFQETGEANAAELLPTPAQIAEAWAVHGESIAAEYLPNTLRVTLVGLALATVLGVLLAVLMDAIPLVRWVLYPALVLSQTIPVFAIAVILILLLGFGDSPKLVVVVLFCFFAVTASTLDGLRSVNAQHLDLLRSMGAGRWAIWWKVRLPSAAPAFFTGLRVAATYSVVGAIIGEYVGGGGGIGQFLQRSYRSFRADQVFLAILVVAALSIALVGAVSLVEYMTLRWRRAGRAAPSRFSSLLTWFRKGKAHA